MGNIKWICTDPSTDQWGRKVGNRIYKFKETVKFPDKSTLKIENEIDLNDYIEKEINEHLTPYGWSINQLKEENSLDDAEWLMAECVFEQTIFN